MTEKMMTGTAYLQIKKDWGSTCRIVKATQNEPGVVQAGCIVVKIKVTVPVSAFRPLEAEVVMVPKDHAAPVVESVPHTGTYQPGGYTD